MTVFRYAVVDGRQSQPSPSGHSPVAHHADSEPMSVTHVVRAPHPVYGNTHTSFCAAEGDPGRIPDYILFRTGYHLVEFVCPVSGTDDSCAVKILAVLSAFILLFL